MFYYSHHVQAGKLYMEVDMMKEALDMFMAGDYWDKARHIATNIAPRYEQYVEDSYVDYLKQHNKTEEVRGWGLLLQDYCAICNIRCVVLTHQVL